MASGTSRRSELNLTNVARASLIELKLDDEDFLRHSKKNKAIRQDKKIGRAREAQIYA